MNLQGYRTIIANVVAVVASVGLFFGVVIPEDERASRGRRSTGGVFGVAGH